MKYSFLSIAIAALAIPAVLVSSSASAKPALTQLTAGPGMAQMLAQKSSILSRLGASPISTPGSASLTGGSSAMAGGGNPPISTVCNYSLVSFPVPVTYSASFLGFTIYQGVHAPVPPQNTPYSFCLFVARQTCQFLQQQIGIPGALDVNFSGNIIQSTKRCGTF